MVISQITCSHSERISCLHRPLASVSWCMVQQLQLKLWVPLWFNALAWSCCSEAVPNRGREASPWGKDQPNRTPSTGKHRSYACALQKDAPHLKGKFVHAVCHLIQRPSSQSCLFALDRQCAQCFVALLYSWQRHVNG